MEETGTSSSKTKRWLILALKVIITAICLWYVSRKIDFAVAAAAIRKAQWLFLFLALVLFIVSKWIAAIRLNIYFRNISIYLPGPTNIRLYWLGMFYNLFLPGSIGGARLTSSSGAWSSRPSSRRCPWRRTSSRRRRCPWSPCRRTSASRSRWRSRSGPPWRRRSTCPWKDPRRPGPRGRRP